MECNKEDAIKAMAMAEVMMEEGNFVAARRLATKAQRLYPGLEDCRKMMCLCDVRCCSDNTRFGGDMDWYDILKVDQDADEVLVKKNYRKLALLLHPDKNKFPGAESAFMLIGEAQRVLLDKGERLLFDARNMMFFANRPVNPTPEYMSASSVRPPSSQTNPLHNARPCVEKQQKASSATTQSAGSNAEKQAQQKANNVKPPSGQTNSPQQQETNVKPAGSENQPQQQTANPLGQTYKTQNAGAYVRKKPQQKANNAKPPSGQTNPTQNAGVYVKKKSQQQANNAKPPLGQTNTTQTGNSNLKNQPRKQPESGDPIELPTFETMCPYCEEIYRNSRHALNKGLTCKRCKKDFIAYEMCAESAAPQSNANQTATRGKKYIASSSGHNKTRENGSAYVKRQPQHQADNVKPHSGQTNTTQADGSRVNRKPQQQANPRVPSRLGKPQAVCPSCADVLLCGNNGSITCQGCKKNFSWCAR